MMYKLLKYALVNNKPYLYTTNAKYAISGQQLAEQAIS